jgi:hypothetical protein
MPQVVTSRSLGNLGGGYHGIKRNIRQVKKDAVERELELLGGDSPAKLTESDVATVVVQTSRLKKLLSD